MQISEEAKLMIMHAGNDVSLAKLCYEGFAVKDENLITDDQEKARYAEERRESCIKRIEENLRLHNPGNTDLQAYLEQLKASDWLTPEGFKNFLKIHNSYTGLAEEIRAQRDG